MRRRTLWALPCALLLLTGCPSRTTRTCPAFEGHPLVEEFFPAPLEDPMRFVSSTGATIDYAFVSVEDSEPFRESAQGSGGDEEDILCRITSERTYRSLELDVDMTLTFARQDMLGVPREEQNLFVDIVFRRPGVDYGSARGPFFLNDITREHDDAFETLRYFERRQFGATEYTDVIEEAAVPSATIVAPDAPPEPLVRRLALARGAGIVEYEQFDGTVYTRLPP